MGSDIQVRSRPGLGSSFWFDLAVQPESAAGTTFAPARAVTGYSGERKTILVIDDAKENRDVAMQMLEPLGFNMVAAADGGECLELARSLRPDLILMDAIMPGMSGEEATRRMRQLPGLRDIPVIVISASASGDAEALSLSAGAAAFLAKPLNLTRLLAKIGELLKLDWTYDSIATEQEITGGTFVVPALAELETLHQLAQIGNMRDILQRCTYLIETDGAYRPFAEQLRTMALSYQTRAIVGFIQKHLEGKHGS
jgi:CheY-like chemotaxis protein